MLTDKQKRFVVEYLVDSNAAQAAIRAGFSKKTAKVKGAQLLKHPEIAAAIRKRQQKIDQKLEITAERVLQEIAKLAFSNIQDFTKVDDNGKPVLDFSNVTRDQYAAVQEIREDATGGAGDGERKVVLRTTVKLSDKTKNLELLGRHLKLFTDKVEVTGFEELAERINRIRTRKNGLSAA